VSRNREMARTKRAEYKARPQEERDRERYERLRERYIKLAALTAVAQARRQDCDLQILEDLESVSQ